MVKIIDKLNQAIEAKKVLHSFEYFPPKTNDGVRNLYDRLDRMGLLEPCWIDVTWGAGGSTSHLTTEICLNSQNICGLDTMMHMTCTNMPKPELLEFLKKAKEGGIQNILALRGDPPHGEQWKQHKEGLAHAVDLVRLIRETHGDFFCIAVAGYPEAHLEATSYEEDLKFLKEKVDAGADLIITQLFYDTELYIKWVADCRKIGIKCPIVPGMMPIHTFAGFKRMTTLCKTKVPQSISDALEPIKDDDEKVKEYGVQLCIQMCQTLLKAGIAPALHFYTLNLEKSVTKILEGLGLVKEIQERRPLPWSGVPNRSKEDVRPVFWSHRPQSYMIRTASWDEFPNGRWGDSRSPAYGDLNDYHLMVLHFDKEFNSKSNWGEPQNQQEVFSVFTRYCSGELTRLPWVDTPMSAESELIKESLIKLNQNGFLTINSQPAIRDVPSTDKVFGWGSPGGYVYQKGYVEFFTSPENLHKLLDLAKRFPTLTYQAVNKKGDTLSNCSAANAITWGVFIGQEIKQPTIVEPDSFHVWKDEAFALWESQWINLYPEAHPSKKLLKEMHDTYYLVNVVENNYISGDVFAVFNVFIQEGIKK
eukprot:TRINITY_DN5030_c0_g1_i1.p1 TRINITY_DN5030_c0_g1~~TRINITY_DN5030_c0_g1_i1.p1  ORF type:complete len:589 (+),score=188.41 TRINITY_DN5030_c0_g1_i1:71-1837(+)